MKLGNPASIQSQRELDSHLDQALRLYNDTQLFCTYLNPLVTRTTRPKTTELALHGMERILTEAKLPAHLKIYVLINSCYTFFNTCRPVDAAADRNVVRLDEAVRLYSRYAPRNNRRDKVALTASCYMVKIHHNLYSQSFEKLETTVADGLNWIHQLSDEQLRTYACWNAMTNFVRIAGWAAVMKPVLQNQESYTWNSIQACLQRITLIPAYTRLNIKRKAKEIPIINRENIAASRIALLALRYIEALKGGKKEQERISEAIYMLGSRCIRPEGRNAKNRILYNNILALISAGGLPSIPTERMELCTDFWDSLCGYSSLEWRGAD
jgi:hypothetical protein